jgi:hypothetical protein
MFYLSKHEIYFQSVEPPPDYPSKSVNLSFIQYFVFLFHNKLMFIKLIVSEWRSAVDRKLFIIANDIRELTDVAHKILRKITVGGQAADDGGQYTEIFSTAFQLDSVEAVDRMERKLEKDLAFRKALVSEECCNAHF